MLGLDGLSTAVVARAFLVPSLAHHTLHAF